ncbi:hypothetical protein GW17_00008509 [Ensete ventricosum]|nr:hypothetical protein GW17_00008509 [Ensete ventricosum]
MGNPPLRSDDSLRLGNPKDTTQTALRLVTRSIGRSTEFCSSPARSPDSDPWIPEREAQSTSRGVDTCRWCSDKCHLRCQPRRSCFGRDRNHVSPLSKRTCGSRRDSVRDDGNLASPVSTVTLAAAKNLPRECRS